MRRAFFILLITTLSFSVSAKGRGAALDRKSVSTHATQESDQADKDPILGLWKGNYFITGIATNKPVSQYTADIKFQFSLYLRLWRINNVDIFTTYTQRCVWDIYQKSNPFRETLFGPGVWASWRKSDQLRLFFGIEHESNGVGNEQSRSFNCATVATIYEPLDHWRFGARAWYGFLFHHKTINPGYFRYRGVMHMWGTFHTRNDRFHVTALVNPTITFAKYNVQIDAEWKMAKRGNWLPSLFVQYCYGYGETMIDYSRRTSKIRIGFSLMNNRSDMY